MLRVEHAQVDHVGLHQVHDRGPDGWRRVRGRDARRPVGRGGLTVGKTVQEQDETE